MGTIELTWHASPFDCRNRDGIPNPRDSSPDDKFPKIFDLDWIAGQYGGREVHALRLPFGPYTTGQFESHAETLYRIGDLLVHNEVRGWHPAWNTRIFSEGEVPEDEVVAAYEQYYGGPARVTRDQAPSIEGTKRSIVRNMVRSQRDYDKRDSPYRAIERLVESVPEHLRSQAVTEVSGLVRERLRF